LRESVVLIQRTAVAVALSVGFLARASTHVPFVLILDAYVCVFVKIVWFGHR
jgi:hypothetical protein